MTTLPMGYFDCPHGVPENHECRDCSMTDMVNHPAHYTAGEIECIDAIAAALGREGFIAYLRGQVMKYTWRLGRKGDAGEDARKAEWYARVLAETLEQVGGSQ